MFIIWSAITVTERNRVHFNHVPTTARIEVASSTGEMCFADNANTEMNVELYIYVKVMPVNDHRILRPVYPRQMPLFLSHHVEKF